jgi:hypothetical protein
VSPLLVLQVAVLPPSPFAPLPFWVCVQVDALEFDCAAAAASSAAAGVAFGVASGSCFPLADATTSSATARAADTANSPLLIFSPPRFWTCWQMPQQQESERRSTTRYASKGGLRQACENQRTFGRVARADK